MSVQTEIDRLASAKAAIKTAIEGKGVTVPDATLLDGMAALIDGIEAGGGGLPSVITEIVGGTYVAADTIGQTFAIAHGLGKTPILAALWSESSNTGELGWFFFFGGGGGIGGSKKGTNLTYANLSDMYKRGEVMNEFSLKPSLSSSGKSAYAGDTFHWLAWA